jgi:sortase A
MNQKKIIRTCGILMGLSGLVILLSSIYPIISYEWYSEVKYPNLVSPLVDEKTADFRLVGKDYSKASNWFEGAGGNSSSTSLIDYYTLTIPKLKIDSATVAIGGEALTENLVQYAGTVNPGKVGNTVIFGHSILPQYFDQNNYLSIFSTLPALKNGDQIFVNYDGITYTYLVTESFEVKPTDLWVLGQDQDDSYISLITCSPPGHPLKPRRLVVKAKIVNT